MNWTAEWFDVHTTLLESLLLRVGASPANIPELLPRLRYMIQGALETDTGSLVLGALVTGTFSGTITENDLTGTTGSDGSTTIDTIGTAKGSMSFEFCVTSISGAGLESFERIYGEACDSL